MRLGFQKVGIACANALGSGRSVPFPGVQRTIMCVFGSKLNKAWVCHTVRVTSASGMKDLAHDGITMPWLSSHPCVRGRAGPGGRHEAVLVLDLALSAFLFPKPEHTHALAPTPNTR